MGSTYQSIRIEAPVEKVWETVRNFHDFSWAPKVIETCEPVGELKGTQIGARRVLNNVFQETLLELSDISKTVRYSIDDGPSPISKGEVSNYVGTLRVHPITDEDSTFVEWSSAWVGNSEKAAEFCRGVYVALLGSLKESLS